MSKELEALWYFINRKSDTLPDIEFSDTEDNRQFMIIQQALIELEELRAEQLNFSVDNEFVHIEGYGVYRKCDLEPENVMKIKIGKVGDKDE